MKLLLAIILFWISSATHIYSQSNNDLKCYCDCQCLANIECFAYIIACDLEEQGIDSLYVNIFKNYEGDSLIYNPSQSLKRINDRFVRALIGIKDKPLLVCSESEIKKNDKAPKTPNDIPYTNENNMDYNPVRGQEVLEQLNYQAELTGTIYVDDDKTELSIIIKRTNRPYLVRSRWSQIILPD